MAKNVTGGGASSTTPTITQTAVDKLQESMVTPSWAQGQKTGAEPVTPTNQPQPNMSKLMDDTVTDSEEVQKQRPVRPDNMINIQRGGEETLQDPVEYVERASEMPTTWDYKQGNFITFNEYGDMPSIEDRVNKVASNFNSGAVTVGITPTPDSPTAPKRLLGDTVSKLGVYRGSGQMDENFLAIGTLVTENAIANAAYVDRSSEEFDIRNFYKPKSKDVEMFETPVESGAMFTKTSMNTKLGYEIAKEHAAHQTNGANTETDISPEEATVLGDAFLEMYARNHPDLIEMANTEGMSNVNKSKLAKVGYFKITERGAEVLNADMKRRNNLFPSKLLRPRKQPTALKVGQEIIPGEKNVTGKVKPKDMTKKNILNDMIKNMGSIGHRVDTRRAKILLMTGLPALLTDPGLPLGTDTSETVGAEINKVGNSKLDEIKAEVLGKMRKDNKDINDPGIQSEINRLAFQRLGGIKNTFANYMYGIAAERGSESFLDFYISSFNYRTAPLQTLFDPTNSKVVRFVTVGQDVVIKMNSRQEKNLRQMYAMSLIKGADSKLPHERERILRESHKDLYTYGNRLRELVDGLSNADYETVMDAISNGEPVQSESFKLIKGLGLNPFNEMEADLLALIKSKGEDGNAYIDGLIDYANYYDALYNPRTRTGNFSTTFNAYMDGKTNGLASAAMILGIKALGYKTGVFRESNTDLLDSGDIRDDVAEKLKVMIESGNMFPGFSPEVTNALKFIASKLIDFRDLHKATTMTFGYGINPEAFSIYIDDAINTIEASGKGGPEFSKHLDFLTKASIEVSGMGSNVANAINMGYTQAVIQSLSTEMLEARSLMAAVGSTFALSDEPYIIEDPIGNPLYFGGFKKQSYEDAFKGRYTVYDESGKPIKKSAVKYGNEKATSAAPKYIGGAPGESAMKAAGVGAIQSVDAATVLSVFTGRSWKRLVDGSNGKPYVYPIYDAFKVDANSYDIVLDEVNRNWAEITMNYNHIAEARKSLFEMVKGFRAKIDEEAKDNGGKVPIGEGSNFAMVGLAIKQSTDKFGNKRYEFLEKLIKNSGIAEEDKVARKIIQNSGINPDSSEVSPQVLFNFIKAYNQGIQLKNRLIALEATIDKNKRDMYKLIGKQTKSGKWIATASDIYQYFAH